MSIEPYIHQINDELFVVRTSPDDMWMKTKSFREAMSMCASITKYLSILKDMENILKNIE